MEVHKYNEGDPSQTVFILTKSPEQFESLWNTPELGDVMFCVFTTPDEVTLLLHLEPDVLVTYIVVKSVKTILTVMRERKQEMKACSLMCVFSNTTDFKRLLEAGGENFLPVEALTTGNVLVTMLEKALGKVDQQRTLQVRRLATCRSM